MNLAWGDSEDEPQEDPVKKQKTMEPINGETPPKRKRGRPKGSKNKKPRKPKEPKEPKLT